MFRTEPSPAIVSHTLQCQNGAAVRRNGAGMVARASYPAVFRAAAPDTPQCHQNGAGLATSTARPDAGCRNSSAHACRHSRGAGPDTRPLSHLNLSTFCGKSGGFHWQNPQQKTAHVETKSGRVSGPAAAPAPTRRTPPRAARPPAAGARCDSCAPAARALHWSTFHLSLSRFCQAGPYTSPLTTSSLKKCVRCS